jgi:hypothetical protein
MEGRIPEAHNGRILYTVQYINEVVKIKKGFMISVA